MTDRERIAEKLREGMARECKIPLTERSGARIESDPYVILAPTVERLIRDAAKRAHSRAWSMARAEYADAQTNLREQIQGMPFPGRADLPADFPLVQP